MDYFQQVLNSEIMNLAIQNLSCLRFHTYLLYVWDLKKKKTCQDGTSPAKIKQAHGHSFRFFTL